MALLDRIHKPSDLRTLSDGELRTLAGEIRQFLISNVARTGGHLGPNLGVVELTMAIHLVFDSPQDPVLFDVGHQSYVHKIVPASSARCVRGAGCPATRAGTSPSTTGSRTRTPRPP